MAKVNDNYLKLPGSYLFSTVAKKAAAYTEANPDKEVIKMSIGDVTKPLAPAVIEAMHKAVDEMGTAEGFHGYGPEQGYDFLRNKIVEKDYAARGIDVKADEIFVSDGAKSDCVNIGDIFSVTIKLQFAILFILYTLILMLWQAEQVTLQTVNGIILYICLARKKTDLCRNFRKKRLI